MGRSGRRIAFLIAAFGPPGALAGGLPRWVGAHPVLFALLALGYFAIVGVLSFIRDVIDKLRGLWQQRMVERLDRAIGLRTSGFDGRYRDFVAGSMRFVDIKGLAKVGANTPELDEVFVDVGLAQRSPHQVPNDLLADVPEEVTERQSLESILGRADPVPLAVLGAPGSGKTTLLRHTARRLSANRGRGTRSVPILLFLRDHAKLIAEDPEVTLPEVVRRTIGTLRDKEPGGWFEQRLENGECVVLLDGLDEVAVAEYRIAVADWIEAQTHQFAGNDYVITSRPRGYRTSPIDGARVHQVRSLTEAQVTAFVRGWYLAVERHSTGFVDADVTARAEEAANDLLDRLHEAPGLHELTVNPLLLTMITNVHREQGALPRGRAELYNDICDVMLWRRRRVKRLADDLGGQKKERVLRVLAFDMMHRRIRDLPKKDAVEVIGPALSRVSREPDPEDFLADVVVDGMLVERNNELLAFAHHTFQEYLAAAYVRQRGDVDVLLESVEDLWWRETTLLYAARSDADPIVAACLEADTVTALALGFDCAEEAREVDPALRDRLEALLVSCFDADSDPERRRLMAQVLIARQLRHLIVVPGGARITSQRVSAEVYRLFLADTNRPEPSVAVPLVPGAQRPALGVPRSEVPALLDWMNEIVDGETGYRLPTESELDDVNVRRTLSTVDGSDVDTVRRQAPSVWSQGAGAPELLVLGETHPHAVAEADVVQQIVDDIATVDTALARLLLVRAIAVLRVLRHDMEHGYLNERTLNLCEHFGECVARALDLAPTDPAAVELVAALNTALAQLIDLAASLDRAVDLAGALDMAAVRGQARATERQRVIALALKLAIPLAANRHAGDRQLIAELEQSLDRELQVARSLAAPLAEELDYALTVHTAPELDGRLAAAAPRRNPAAARPDDVDDQVDALVGPTLSRTLSEALAGAEQDGHGEGRHFRAEFGRAFVAASGLHKDRVVAPERLGELLNAACRLSLDGWAAEALGRLVELAEPVFAGESPADAATAGAIRVIALCLAADGVTAATDETDIGELFGTIAAGVTLLQWRADGRAPLTESVVLAVD